MKRVLGVLLFCLIVCLAAQAQLTGSGSIQGLVEDPSGAVIPNAAVTLTNVATGVHQATKTDDAGAYTFPNLVIGTYSISVAAPGFQNYVQSNIVLEVGSSIAIDVKMTIGGADQTVQVEAQGLALQTEDTSFKQTIDQTDVTEMPLNGRHMTDLITLSGASTTAPAGDFTGSKYSYAAVSVSVAGGMGNTTEWKLDGGTNNDFMANSNLPFPFPDAVNEFSVESTNLGASTGAHTGGLVNVVTRSGTNQFHGTGFEFIRNNIIDATNFFAVGKDQLHQNEYGGTIGGPVLKDKLFFFTGFQRLVSKQLSATTSVYLPTAANLAGDFSVTDPPPGSATNVCGDKAVQLYDPVTGALLPGNKYGQAGGPALPTWNPAAIALEAYLPKIVPLADGSNACGHVQYGIPNDVFDKQSITRMDYTLNSRNTLYGHYFLDGYQAPPPYSPTNILLTTQSGNIERTQSATLGEDFVVSQNLVNSAHVTYLRRRNNRGYSLADINATTLGVNAFQLEQHGLQMTVSTSGANHKFTIGGGTNSIASFNDNSIAVADAVTWTHGKHQLIFGGEWIHNQLNINNAYESNGVFTFNGQYSGDAAGDGKTIGDANLDFLGGAMQTFQQSKAQQNALRGNIPSLYFQDTYHASTRLTMVAGVRWTPTYYPVDYFNRGVEFNMQGFLLNAISSVYPNAPPGITFFGDPNVHRQFTSNSPAQWSPNIGVTFDPVGNGKTVLRAGFQFAFDQPNYFTSQRNQQNPPYATASSPTTSAELCFSNPWLVGGTGNRGCGQTGGNTSDNTYPSPQVPTKANAVFPAQSQYIATAYNFRPSATSMWTASVQHTFGRGWQVQADYIGNRTTHEANGYPLDDAAFIPGVWPNCPGFVTTGPAAVKAGTAGTNCSTTSNYISRLLLTIANPVGNGVNGGGNQYLGGAAGSVLINNVAWSDYNGLVLSANHRLSSTFSLLANYTWSKCLDVEDASGDVAGDSFENPNNARLDYGPCGQDFRNVFSASIVATSRVKRFNRVVNAILSDWQAAPLFHANTGSPINITTGVDISLIDVNKDRPNLIAGQPVYLPSHPFINSATEADEGYLNPAAFQTVLAAAGCTKATLNGCPAYGTFGTLGRNAFHGLSQFQFDGEISRYFPIHESVKLNLRLEAFNVLNHPVFANPNAGLSSDGVTSAASFGLISGTTGEGARVFQGAVKIIF
jgi:hypothetical protein